MLRTSYSSSITGKSDFAGVDEKKWVELTVEALEKLSHDGATTADELCNQVIRSLR